MKAFGLMSTITSYVVGAVLIGVFGGRWLDERLDGDGIYLVIAMLTGMTAAFYGIYKAVRQFMGDGEDSS